MTRKSLAERGMRQSTRIAAMSKFRPTCRSVDNVSIRLDAASAVIVYACNFSPAFLLHSFEPRRLESLYLHEEEGEDAPRTALGGDCSQLRNSTILTMSSNYGQAYTNFCDPRRRSHSVRR